MEGRGKIARVDVSTDAGKTWQVATLDETGAVESAHAFLAHVGVDGQRDDHPESRDRRNGLRSADARRVDARARGRHAVSLQSDLRVASDAERPSLFSRRHMSGPTLPSRRPVHPATQRCHPRCALLLAFELVASISNAPRQHYGLGTPPRAPTSRRATSTSVRTARAFRREAALW